MTLSLRVKHAVAEEERCCLCCLATEGGLAVTGDMQVYCYHGIVTTCVLLLSLMHSPEFAGI